jgi:dipeptidyl-peptidase 4
MENVNAPIPNSSPPFARPGRARLWPCGILLLAFLFEFEPGRLVAQDRLKTMPGYQRYREMSREIPSSLKSGALTVTWKDEGKALEYRRDGKRYRYDLTIGTATELKEPKAEPGRRDRPPGSRGGLGGIRPGSERPARGRQFTAALSPDGRLKAFNRDRNLWLSDTNGSNAFAITTDGNDRNRIKSGTATWVYGEELYQRTALWWSPDGKKLAFYRFDESRVPDFYLELNQTKLLSSMDVEPYVKAGGTNPVVDLLIYDVGTKNTTRVQVRDGQPFDDEVVGHYVYGIEWSADGKELLLHRTNRRQNIMEFCAADPNTGRCRVIVREAWPASWTENTPEITFLKDGRRFVWTSERTGWKNLYLYDLSGPLLATLTRHAFEVAGVVRVDEAAGRVYYLARDGNNPMKPQLHRVSLKGENDVRLTDPAYSHNVNIAPDGRHFVDIEQTHDEPPVTRLRGTDDGGLIDELARSDLTKFKKLKLRPVELLTFKAADGQTDLYGLLHFPSHFKWYKKYPLLVSVYGGPATTGARETFTLPNALTELGFLVASFDARSASGRGKRFLDAIYEKLGRTEIDDLAAGVKSLWNRRYVDRKHVGIYGTSYGGYASLMCLLRYPDVFQAASASSPPTAWYHYDSIYTERYMWKPQENVAGYAAGDATKLAGKLEGRLLLYYGTADNNVHPNNSLQLIQALQKAGKSFELQVGPDQGHGSVNRDRMMEFFLESLDQD